MVLRDFARFIGEIRDFGLAEQQRLAIRNAFAFLAVHGGLERGLDDLDRVRIVAGTFQRFDHSAGDRLADRTAAVAPSIRCSAWMSSAMRQ